MQNAQSVYLKTIQALLEENEIEKALEALRQLDEKSQAGIWQDVAQQSGNYKEASKSFQRGLIGFEEYNRFVARTRFALLDLMKDIPGRVQRNAQLRNLDTFQFQVPDEARLEKIIGQQSTLLRINWLEKALQASKAVCRVVCADGELGTGFITREGYLFTNNHVIPDAEVAREARIEFNYEIGADGQVKARTAYQLDGADFQTSPPDQLDFSRIRVIDRPDLPLSRWGFVEFDTSVPPATGDAVTIIQHPKGEDKQIALKANEVVGHWNQHLFYTADTEPGSSGSPVFNKDWKVVAIHHAGKTDAEGGMQINARGDRRGANRGILFEKIFEALGTAPAGAGPRSGTGSAPTETTAPTGAGGGSPAPSSREGAELRSATESATTTAAAPMAGAATVSAIPKFVVIYAAEDEMHSGLLNKHLNVLKITKKIRVYNVISGAFGGDDPMARARQELTDADYIICLVTVNLFNSEWFALVFEALENGRRVIPIRVENADLDGTGLEKLKSLPTLNRVVQSFLQIDAAYADIVAELKKLLPKA
jgi:V8-like Glu-specific endopeptidase